MCKVRVGVLTLAVAVVFGGTARAGFVNGSFETGVNPPTSFSDAEVAAGSDRITGWTIGNGGVDWYGSDFAWQASDGMYSLDLNRRAAGSIGQTVVTQPGVTYLVSFDLSRNPDDRGPDPRLMSATAVGVASQTYSVADTGQTASDMRWQRQTFAFTAVAASTTVRFASLTGSAFGPALDNASIAAVPAPATALLGLMSAPVLAYVRRRRAA